VIDEATDAGSLFEEAVSGAGTKIVPHIAYQRDPLRWMVEKLGVPQSHLVWSQNRGYERHHWDGTPDPFLVAMQGLADWHNVGIESCTTSGKTWWLARIALWFVACFENARVVTVAPKEEQLKMHLWAELDGAWEGFARHFPLAERGSRAVQMRPGSNRWGIFAFVAGVRAEEVATSATKAQGWHAEHLLVIHEEMPGTHPAIVNAFRQTCKAPHNLRLGVGNPDHQLDQLHQFVTAPSTVAVRISAYDHPNVVTGNPQLIPGAMSPKGIQDSIEVDGEGTRLFESRIRGISPKQATDGLLQLEWIERAMERGKREWLRMETLRREGVTLQAQKVRRSFGVDAAQSEAGDKSAVSEWWDAICVDVESKPCPNATDLGTEVWGKMCREDAPVEADHVGVDVVGIGAATGNELRRLAGLGVQCLLSGNPPIKHAQREDGVATEWVMDSNRFLNLRAQMYWQLREDLRNERIGLPNRPELVRELMAQRYTTDGGKVKMLEKSKIKQALGGRSPDEADAVCYGNWVRPRDPLPAPPPPRIDFNVQDRNVIQVERTAPPFDFMGAMLPEGY
jgi:hypothetical protein